MHRARRIALISRGTTCRVYVRVCTCVYIYASPRSSQGGQRGWEETATVNAAPLDLSGEHF